MCPLAAADRLLDEIVRLQNQQQRQKYKLVEPEKQKANIISKGVAEVSIPVLSLKYASNNLITWIRVVTGKIEGVQELPTHEAGFVAAVKNSLSEFPLEQFTNCLMVRQIFQVLSSNETKRLFNVFGRN